MSDPVDAVVILNGKAIPIANAPILQFWVPLRGELQKGKNTVELRGHVYTFWGGGGFQEVVKALDARIIAAEAQASKIFNGPILGDFGEGYFTFACRTQLPART